MNYIHNENGDLGKPNKRAVADLEPGEPISPAEARGMLIAACRVCHIIAGEDYVPTLASACSPRTQEGRRSRVQQRRRVLAEIGLLQFMRKIRFARRRLQHDVPLCQRIDAVGGCERLLDQLFDEQDGCTVIAELSEHSQHTIDKERG